MTWNVRKSAMPSLFKSETLQLKITKSSPFIRGFLYFLLTILLVLLGAEIVAPSQLGTILPAPSVNADSFLFDAKIHALESQVRREGGLDCLFMGSSVTNSGIDPEIIERIYREQTGQRIDCYNLGLPAMTIENATALTDAVITRFHPKVVIYTVLTRDIDHAVASADFIEESDWLKFNRGEPSLNGWLVNHSHAYRYFLTWRYWLVVQNRNKMREETMYLTAKGYQPAVGIRDPYPANLTMTPNRLSRLWNNPRRAQAVEDFLALQERGVRIVFVEGPTYREPGTDAAALEALQAYEHDYIPNLQKLLEAGGVPFWRTDLVIGGIPKPHWYDWLHLNSQGAITFSQWLGERLAENKWLFQ